MRILIVGAGAVGQTFGTLLWRGGAAVTYLVKPRHRAEAEAGFPLYDLGNRRETSPEVFSDFEVVTDVGAVSESPPDVVLITVASNALYDGDWLEALADAAPEATFCGLQPGLGDWDRVRGVVGADRVVWGLIELIAYQAPLPGEDRPEPGVAFWIPRWLRFPFSGPDRRTREVVGAMRAGGARAVRVDDVTTLTAVGAPVLNLHMAALEVSDWQLSRVVGDRELRALTVRAVRQASAAAAHSCGIAVPWWVRWLRPWQVGVVGRVAPRLTPFDLETYLAFHFKKVGPQTRRSLRCWIETARDAGLDHDALTAMAARLSIEGI